LANYKVPEQFEDTIKSIRSDEMKVKEISQETSMKLKTTKWIISTITSVVMGGSLVCGADADNALKMPPIAGRILARGGTGVTCDKNLSP